MASTPSALLARLSRRWFWMMLAFLVVGIMGANGRNAANKVLSDWKRGKA